MKVPVNYGNGLSATDSEICEIEATFKYDLAIKITDAKTATESA